MRSGSQIYVVRLLHVATSNAVSTQQHETVQESQNNMNHVCSAAAVAKLH